MLTDDTKSNEFIKGVLKERIRKREDVQTAIEWPVSINSGRGEPLSPYMGKVTRAYEEADFMEEQKFVFLSIAAPNAGGIRQFVFLRAPNIFSMLVSTLYVYEELERRFLTCSSKLSSNLIQEIYRVNHWKSKRGVAINRKGDIE